MPVLQYITLRVSIGATTISEFQNLRQFCGRWLCINYSLLREPFSAPWTVGGPDFPECLPEQFLLILFQIMIKFYIYMYMITSN